MSRILKLERNCRVLCRRPTAWPEFAQTISRILRRCLVVCLTVYFANRFTQNITSNYALSLHSYMLSTHHNLLTHAQKSTAWNNSIYILFAQLHEAEALCFAIFCPKPALQENRSRTSTKERWFENQQLAPLHVTYENLSDDPTGTLNRLLAGLGLNRAAANEIVPNIARLADETNQVWAKRYRTKSGSTSGKL